MLLSYVGLAVTSGSLHKPKVCCPSFHRRPSNVRVLPGNHVCLFVFFILPETRSKGPSIPPPSNTFSCKAPHNGDPSHFVFGKKNKSDRKQGTDAKECAGLLYYTNAFTSSLDGHIFAVNSDFCPAQLRTEKKNGGSLKKRTKAFE